MEKNKRAPLTDLYDKRYRKGYMDDWPIEKKNRVKEIIASLGLPAAGNALDFGCGNGVLTDIVRRALPGWRVFGTDISKTAVLNAEKRYPNCNFFSPEDKDFQGNKFDFVFSNHVFEHVYDLNETFSRMIDFLKPASSMLHILPCGNKGSFERNICLLRRNGINKNRENRFFFEVKGHLRRLTTDQLKGLAEEHGFLLDKAYYASQHYGALEWITTSNMAFVLRFTDRSKAVNWEAGKKLIKWRYFLSTVFLLRKFWRDYLDWAANRNEDTILKRINLFKIPLLPVPYLLDLYFMHKSKQEWRTRKTDPLGSEMHLYFKRDIALFV